ncbi:MAG: penicillin-binding protein 2 [Candidatus Dojkabacteria bacterium]|nr:MAG: penicillin-binding protein 2 [Candidatus Dojkabacteria bacterium]
MRGSILPLLQKQLRDKTSAFAEQDKTTQNSFIGAIFLGILITISYIGYGLISITVTENSKYIALAQDNSLFKEPIFASRGIIFDSEGIPLVQNDKTFDLYYVQKYLSLEEIAILYPAIADELEEYKAEHTEETEDTITPRLIVHKVPKEIAIDVQAKRHEGLFVKSSYVRQYIQGPEFSHLLGYTGLVSDTDLKRDPSLFYNEVTGKSGIEVQYDKELRGIHGSRYIETNAFGEQSSEFQGYLVDPQHGSNITLTINATYQKVLFDKVKKYVDMHHAKGGSAVVLDVRSGAVKALVSYPSYDNNLFVGGISSKDYKTLLDNPQTPLLYRPISSQEPPGSTFKTLVASAALQSGSITRNTTFNAPGVIYLSGGQPFQDYRKRVHGTLDVRSALMVSSNIFFCRTIIEMGIEPFLGYAEKFGVGKQAGIDIPGEMKGRIPSPENKLWLAQNGAYWLDEIWYPEGDACNAAIGQGITLATPLQMASIASTIANGGTVYRPYLAQKVMKQNAEEVSHQPEVIESGFISPENLQTVRQGMRMGITEQRGIITSLRNTPFTVAAKTGTAEFGVKDKDGYLTAHAWIIGFFPYEDPQYAFAILLEGGSDSSRAAAVIREFLQDNEVKKRFEENK